MDQDIGRLVVWCKPGEIFTFNKDQIIIKILQVGGKGVRVCIEAPKCVKIGREHMDGSDQ